MTKKNFQLIHNLDGLTEAQKVQYLADFSEHLGLPPDLGALDLIWMDDDNKSGLRKLVVYCRKGTADLLRGIHGIEIQSIEQLVVPGCVTFKATGKNSTGRQEIAIGSHDTEGLKGGRLASAVMTAQSRSLRRLTLQFVGGGLLDESEVSTQSTNINRTESSLAQLAGSPTVLPPPQVLPAAAPGKDITQPSFAELVEACENPLIALADVCTKSATPETVSKIPQNDQIVSSAQILAPVVQSTPESVSSVPQTTPEIPKEVESSPVSAEPPKKRRGRGPGKKKNTVDISSPGQMTMPPGHIDAEGIVRPVDEPAKCIDCGQPLKDHEYLHGKGYTCKASVPPATAKEPEEGTVGTGGLSIPPLAEPAPIQTSPFKEVATASAVPWQTPVLPPASVQVNSAVPTQVNPVAPKIDQAAMTAYNTRFRHYANEVLPGGGMMPSEGLGIVAKARKFAATFTGAKDTTYMDTQQWDDLFNFLDDYTAKNGAAQLVAFIHKTIGIQ